MTTAWGILDQKLSYFLNDAARAGGESKYKLPLRVGAWNWAQRELAQHTAREMVVSPVGLEPDGRSSVLPADFLQVAQVFDVDNSLVLAPAHFEPGGYRDNGSDNPSYWVWGDSLRFEASVTSKLELYYYAYWPDVVYDEEETRFLQEQVFVPRWAELPLLHLTAASVLQPYAIATARNRENATKLDSGTPEDNPTARQAREHLWWYHELLGQHTAQARLGGVAA